MQSIKSQSFIDSILGQVADHLSKQQGLFVKKQTKKSILKIIKTATENEKSEDESGESLANEYLRDYQKTPPMKQINEREEECYAKNAVAPYHWELKEWNKFIEKMETLTGEQLLNVQTKRVNQGKNKKGLTIDEKWRLCIAKGEEDELDAVVYFLRKNYDTPVGQWADEWDTLPFDVRVNETEKWQEKHQSDGSESEGVSQDMINLFAMYTKGKEAKIELESLKKAIHYAEADAAYINMETRRKIARNAKNEKKFRFDDGLMLAIPIHNKTISFAQVRKFIE